MRFARLYIRFKGGRFRAARARVIANVSGCPNGSEHEGDKSHRHQHLYRREREPVSRRLGSSWQSGRLISCAQIVPNEK